jgi:peroxiredoxin
MASLLAALSLLAAGVPVGSNPPAFTLPDGSGKVHRLDATRGSITVVFFYRGHW